MPPTGAYLLLWFSVFVPRVARLVEDGPHEGHYSIYYDNDTERGSYHQTLDLALSWLRSVAAGYGATLGDPEVRGDVLVVEIQVSGQEHQ